MGMSVGTAEELLTLYGEMLYERITWDQTWMDIAQYLAPHQSEIQTKTVAGSRQTTHLYDVTGVDAWDKLTSAIMGANYSSVVPPFTLVPRANELKTDFEVLNWLEVVSTDIFDTINASNFELVAPGMVADTSGFGTGAMGVFEIEMGQGARSRGFRGLHHVALPIGTYCIDQDAWGLVDTLIRTMWMSGRALLRRWPDADYPTTLKEKILRHPIQPVMVVHGVTPKITGGKRGWDSVYVLAGMDALLVPGMLPSTGEGIVELESGSFLEFPYQVPRWYQTSGENWGRGRGHLAFPEMRTANRARQLKLRAWAKTIDPPLKVLNRGVLGRVRLVPGAENIVRDMGALEAMDFKIRFDHQAIPEQESKLQIRQMFFTEQLLQFATDRKTPPTATEVLQRMDFLHQLLGPAAGRLRTEQQTPYIKRVFNMKLRAGDFPEPPQQLLQAGGVIDIEYLGPLARAQHNDELRGINDTLSLVTAMTGVDPNVPDNYNWDQMARDLPRVTGVSRRYLVQEEVRNARREERAAQQQALMQQQEAMAVGQVAKDLGAAGAADAQAAQAGGV